MKRSNKSPQIKRDFFYYFFTIIFSTVVVSLMMRLVPKLYEKGLISYNFMDCFIIKYLFYAIPFIGSSCIIFWYKKKGKSIKIFNDAIIFSFAAIGIYAIMYFDNNSIKNEFYYYLFVDLSLFCVKLLILMCSIAKAVMTLMEFIDERSKELVVSSEHIKNTENKNVNLITIISIASLILLIKKIK